MSKLPVVSGPQAVRAFRKFGYEVDHQTGSHVALWRESEDRRVIVPFHNRDLGRGLTLRIIKSAGLTREEFVKLLK